MEQEQRRCSMAMGPDFDPYLGAPEAEHPIQFLGLSTGDEAPRFYREEDFGGITPGRPS